MKFHRIGEDKRQSRGFYVAVWDIPINEEGLLYLYKDGVVREGVGDDSTLSFWPTLKEANTFYEDWRK